MKIFIRYLKVYFKILEISFSELTTYRFSFYLWSLVHIFELVVNISFFKLIYLKTDLIGGWNIYQVLILLGFMELTIAIGALTFYPMMWSFANMIRKGDLDGKLIKPLDIQFLVTFPEIDYTDTLSLITGSILIIYGASHIASVSAVSVILFLLLIVSSFVILYSIVLMLITLAFKTTKINALDDFYWNLQWIGRYPSTVFKGIAHFVIMFIVPIGLVSTVPAQTLAGVINPGEIAYSFGLAAILFSISRRVFLANIRNYTSASS